MAKTIESVQVSFKILDGVNETGLPKERQIIVRHIYDGYSDVEILALAEALNMVLPSEVVSSTVTTKTSIQ